MQIFHDYYRICFNDFCVYSDVMPPDEYHWPVNDSVYTNYVAKISLQTVEKIPFANSKKSYKNIADNIYIPFNVTGQWHPEYDSYEEGLYTYY